MFRHQSFDLVPVLSAKRVADAISTNSFGFRYKKDPSPAERRALTSSLRPGVSAQDFFAGIARQHKQHTTQFAGTGKLKEGTAVWILGSFMNHSSTGMTGSRMFHGKMLFVHAMHPLKAGDEVTTTYSEDREALKKWGIFN